MASNKFVPFKGSIEVKPFDRKGIVVSQDVSLIEAGEVISVGEGVTFFKVGDIAHFEAWGCSKTVKDIDGVEHYVVFVKEEIIRGKHAKE